MAPPQAPLLHIFIAQSLGAVSEVCGQRITQACHHRSMIRVLVSSSVTAGAQAFIVLAVAETLLPSSWTGGQGSLSMWATLAAHPALLLNAVNNTVYMLAIAHMLTHAFGAVLVVLAFLCASFLVDPMQALLGMSPSTSLNPYAAALGITGACMCILHLPQRVCDETLAALQRLLPWRAPTPHIILRPPTASVNGEEEGNSDAAAPEGEDDALVPPTPAVLPSLPQRKSNMSLTVAFLTLMATTAVGVVIATYFQRVAGLNSFGYAAVDQVLLPFTTLPLVAVMAHMPACRRAVGESDTAPHSFVSTLALTWAELSATQGQANHQTQSAEWMACFAPIVHLVRDRFWPALLGFHSLEFCRTLLFFYLVTNFDVESTYMQMTLLRVVLCWLASLAACSFFRGWVGISDEDAALALHPIVLTLRITGSTLLVVSIVIAKVV